MFRQLRGEGRMEKIRIITINTWKCDGNYDRRMELLAEQLKPLSPGIIACQECFSSEDAGVDTLAFLAEQLNMQACFLPGRFKKRVFRQQWVNSYSGLGVLAVYPIKTVESHSLPVTPGDEDRKLQLVEIDIPGADQLLLANTHLTHLKNTPARTAQAEFVAKTVLAMNNYKYRVICGDFNSVQDSPEMQSLKTKAKAVDCYTAGSGAEPRCSLAEACEKNVMICVDHQFALAFPGKDRFPQFENSHIVLNVKDKENWIYPSDHFGLSTTLILN
jgi:endonuclease/exonuclease/phosphatase family metal-dependent hydrolase